MVAVLRSMAVLMVLAVLGTACGGMAEQLEADVLAVSAEGTIGEGSAAFTTVVENVGGLEGPMAAFAGGSRQQGVVDFAGQRSLVTMTIEGQAALLTGERLEIRQIGNDIWGRYEGGLVDTGEDRWVALTLSDEALGTAGQAPAFQDPGTMLTTLVDNGVALTEVGPDDLDGTPATLHEGPAPLVVLLQASGQSLAEGFAQGFDGQVPGVTFDTEAFTDAYTAALEGQVGQVGLWVDEDGRARQVRMEYPLGTVTGALVEGMAAAMGLPEDLTTQMLGPMTAVGDVQQVTTTTFSDFGVTVEVTAPSPDQVISMEEFQAGIAQALAEDPAALEQLQALGSGGLGGQ